MLCSAPVSMRRKGGRADAEGVIKGSPCLSLPWASKELSALIGGTQKETVMLPIRRFDNHAGWGTVLIMSPGFSSRIHTEQDLP